VAVNTRAPELAALSYEDLEVFGTGSDGLLFRGVRDDRSRLYVLPDLAPGS
jgi:hypothetical protein